MRPSSSARTTNQSAAVQQTVPQDQRKELVAPLAPATQPGGQEEVVQQQTPKTENDRDAIIKKMATAVMEVAELPPPASQPTTQPGETTAGTGGGAP